MSLMTVWNGLAQAGLPVPYGLSQVARDRPSAASGLPLDAMSNAGVGAPLPAK
jgi:hypothetical protein